MTAGLNLARARCAAASSDGSVSSCARSSWHAASREIGVAPAVAKSAAIAHSASEDKVAIFNFSTSKLALSNPQILLATIITDPENPCPFVDFAKCSRSLNKEHMDASTCATYYQSGEHFNT